MEAEEEQKQGKPVFVIDDEIENDSAPAKTSKPEKKQRKPQFVKEVNKSKISSAISSGDAYAAFEASNPLSLLEFRDFEGRVKKLVYNSSDITIKQLQYVLGKDFDDFVDLTDKDSQISKILSSPPFEPKVAESEDDWMKSTIDVDRLLLFGLLYCKGDKKVKCLAFYDILQDALQEDISAGDKDITFAIVWLYELSTHWVHTWALENAKAQGFEDKINQEKLCERFADKSSLKENLEELHEDFLDDSFGDMSRISRLEFLKTIEKSCLYLFDPEEQRKKVLEKVS